MAGYELTPEEIKLFLEEAYEQLQIMEETLIALEEDPDNTALIQEVFRAAHTLKGGSATAGFDNIARLTHSMESLLELVRQGVRAMGPEIADPLLQGVDVVRQALDAIARDGDGEAVDVSALIQLLEEQKSLEADAWQAASGDWDAGGTTAPGEGADGGAGQGGTTGGDGGEEGHGGAGGDGAVEIEVIIAPDAPMPSVRAYQVLLSLDDLGAVLSCEPERRHIEEVGGDIRRVWALLETAAGPEVIQSALLSIPDIAAVTVKPAPEAVSNTGAAPAPQVQSGTAGVSGPTSAGDTSAVDTGAAPASEGSGQIPSSGTTPVGESAAQAGAAPQASSSATQGDASAAPTDAGAAQPSSTDAPKSAAPARRPQRAAAARQAADSDSGGQSAFGSTIRVDVGLLDNLMNLVGELVIDRTRLAQLAIGEHSLNALKEELASVSNSLSRITTDLQDAIMQARMMPVDTLFKRFPRMVRDLSRQLGKEIDFEMSGNETELDRSVIEIIGDPLIHLLRNAIDHGIEPAEERRRLGKSVRGKLRVRAYHQENHIYIEVSDDGRGLSPEVIMRKVVDRGILRPEEASRLSREELLEYIFAPGFSTASEVSAVSGRGVGMDVVKRNVEKVNGAVTVVTEEGKGTSFTIKLPLTLVIVQALMVEIAGCVMAIPLSNVTEAVHVAPSEVHKASGWEMIAVRDQMVPLLNPQAVWGHEWAVGSDNGRTFPVVILRSGSSPLGLKVDRLLGEQEIVIKTMGPVVGDVPGISGASILGDGRVALIVDPAGLSNAVKHTAIANGV